MLKSDIQIQESMMKRPDLSGVPAEIQKYIDF